MPAQAVATAMGVPGSNWLLDLNLGGQAPCYLVTQAAMAVHLGLARTRRRVPRAQRAQRRARRHQPRARARRPTSGTRSASPRTCTTSRCGRAGSSSRPARPRKTSRTSRSRSASGPSRTSAPYLRAPHSVEAHLAAPYVAEPFRVPDCTIEVDGACALVVTTLDAARDLAQHARRAPGRRVRRGRGAGLDMGDSLFWEDLSRNYTGAARRRPLGLGRPARPATSTSPRSTTASRAPC